MSFQFEQPIFVFFWVILLVGIIKIKNLKIKLALILCCVTLFLFNPIRTKQSSMSQHERSVFTAETLPERVTTGNKTFEQKQLDQLTKLKKESKEITNEEI